MIGFYIVIGVLVGLGVLDQILTILVYGSFVSKYTENIYMSLDESKLRLNMFNPEIISTDCYISKVAGCRILTKYFICGHGTVPRWSPLHKRIEEYYHIAMRNGQYHFS